MIPGRNRELGRKGDSSFAIGRRNWNCYVDVAFPHCSKNEEPGRLQLSDWVPQWTSHSSRDSRETVRFSWAQDRVVEWTEVGVYLIFSKCDRTNSSRNHLNYSARPPITWFPNFHEARSHGQPYPPSTINWPSLTEDPHPFLTPRL